MSRLLLLLVALILWLGFAVLRFDRDELDKFVVTGVESDPAGYAVSFRYYHADSSQQFYAVWLLPAARPLGSTEPVRGHHQPVLLSVASGNVTSLRWLNGRMTAEVPKTVEVRKDVSSCYFEYERPNVVCINPQFVDAR